ncbi:MAG TPA: hypothetical protein VK841_10130 [Polyangiaceae bacterium]|nr:hypothetical protein [Polyangiaceae bacterium]
MLLLGSNTHHVTVHCLRGEQHQQTCEKELSLIGVEEETMHTSTRQPATSGPPLVVPFAFVLSVCSHVIPLGNRHQWKH